MTGRRPWWTASAHAERRPFLIGRAAIVKALRAHFAETDFVEVETSVLQVSPGNETHIHAFGTELISPAGPRTRRYLRTWHPKRESSRLNILPGRIHSRLTCVWCPTALTAIRKLVPSV